MSEQATKPVLERVDKKRRGFVKKVLLGGAFATPLMASFRMDSLSVKSARRVQFSNQEGDSPLLRLLRFLLSLLHKLLG